MTIVLAATLFPLLMIAAAAGDVLTMRISNWLNLLIAALFPPLALAAGMPWEMIGLHAAAGAAMLVAGYGLFALGLFGGGDAKLMAAASLWLGWTGLPAFIMVTALAGGILGLLVLLRAALVRKAAAAHSGGAAQLDVPYGAALAAGAIHAFGASWWMTAALP
jgi:prepilin peptidase CpaA